MPGECFVAGTLVATPAGSKPIEDIKLGERVLTPETKDGGAPQTGVDESTWRVFSLELQNPKANTNDEIEIKLLRPANWLETEHSTNGTVELNLNDIDLHGTAHLTGISQCPHIDSGSGRVVLMTITHRNNHVWNLTIEGESQPIGVTDVHRMFSATRNGWVSACRLNVGESLRSATETPTVISAAHMVGIFRVYNLEVERSTAITFLRPRS